jgi:hypothetical protein
MDGEEIDVNQSRGDPVSLVARVCRTWFDKHSGQAYEARFIS